MRALVCLLATTLLAACSGDEPSLAPDAGPRDAAAVDSGLRDAGSPADATVSLDAGSAADASEGGPVDVVFRVRVPADTPADEPVHVAGDFQGWDPSDPAYALERAPDGRYAITLSFEVGDAIAFKFARGDWSKVEKGPNGEEIADRTLTVDGPGEHTFTVASWADGSPLPRTLSGDVTEHSEPGVLSGRRLWVYLPPGYDAAPSARYPVLYMLDGQNVFDQSTSFAGEWGVDEALETLIPSGEVEPLIVVAIDNSAARLDEYTPWEGEYQGSPAGGGGQAHLRAIVDEVKPWVDQTFRTRPGPAHTGFSGSSLGGLMSVYAAYARPDVFGRVGALSPSLWWDDERLTAFVQAEDKPLGVRLWIDMGTMESSLGELAVIAAALRADGFVEGDDLRVVEVQGAGHNEAAWRARFPDVLRFLFPAE